MVEYRKMINYPGYVDMCVSMPALVELIAAESIASRFLKNNSQVFPPCQIWIVKYYVNCAVKKFVLIYKIPDGFFKITSCIGIFILLRF